MAINYEDIAKEFDYPTYEVEPLDLSSYGQMSEDIKSNQQEQMNWLDQYMYDPEQSKSMSEHIDTLLDPYGSYIQEARTEAEKKAEEAGYLKSGMAAGAGEAQAIDKVGNVAYGNMRSEMYNAYTQNYQSMLQYADAREKAMNTFTQQFELGAKDVYANIYDQFTDKMQQYALEQLDHGAMYDSYLNFNRASYDLDLTQYAQTEERLRQSLKDKAGVMSFYMDSYNQIVTSDMRQEDKFARLQELIKQTEAQLNSGIPSIPDSAYQIGDVPDIDLLGPDSGAAHYKWDGGDATFEYDKLNDVMTELRGKIHAVTSHAEREAYLPWGDMEFILDYMDRVKRDNPEAFSTMMEWMNRHGSNQINDDWEGVMRTLVNLMRGSDITTMFDRWSVVRVLDSDNDLYISEGYAPRYDPVQDAIVYDKYSKNAYGQIQLVQSGLEEARVPEYDAGATLQDKLNAIDWNTVNELGAQSKQYILDNYNQSTYQSIVDWYNDNQQYSQEDLDKGIHLLSNDLLFRLETDKYYDYITSLPEFRRITNTPNGTIDTYDSYQYKNGSVTVTRMVGFPELRMILTEEQALQNVYNECTEYYQDLSCTKYHTVEDYVASLG